MSAPKTALPDTEKERVRKAVQKIRTEIRDIRQNSAIPKNDSQAAAAFVQEYQGDFKYLPERKLWLEWRENKWQPDPTEGFGRAQEFARGLIDQTAELDSERERTAVMPLAISRGSDKALTAMLKLVKHDPLIMDVITSFDTNPNIFGLKNGVVDLTTGAFREEDRLDMILTHVDYDFDAVADCPQWSAALRLVTEENTDLAGYLQRLTGYILAGHPEEHILPVLNGGGSNGKSTYIETMLMLFGPYAFKADSDLYTEDYFGKTPETKIAMLRGKRLVSGVEIKEGVRLAEARIKDLTGGDTLCARELYGKPFNFKPEFTILLYGNHLPMISGTDRGIWRRLKRIPFNAQIVNKDTGIKGKLGAELPGIFNWALAGCLKWRKDGRLDEPTCILEATAEYQEQEDDVQAFIDECCETGGPEKKTKRGDLYEAYCAWTGKYAVGTKLFYARLRSKKFPDRRQKDNVWYFVGLKLKIS